jgi:hypothetical protein
MDPSRTIDDLPTARALIASLQEQLTTSQRQIVALRHELDILCQRLFGKKSERVDPRQLQLALEQLQNERGAVTEPVEMDSGETPVRGHTRHRPTGRRPLPAHLPRRRVEIDIADSDKQCACGHPRTRIGEDVSEKLEYEPASFVVIETVRPKMPARTATKASSKRPRHRRRWSARSRVKDCLPMWSYRNMSTIVCHEHTLRRRCEAV